MICFLFLHSLVSLSLFSVASCLYAPKFPLFNSTTAVSVTGSGLVPASTNPPTCGYILQTTQLLWVETGSALSTSTIVAATHIIIFDPKTNTTRTSVKQNDAITSADSPTSTLETNGGGTQITSLTFSDSVAQTNYTTVIAFPTVYVEYSDSYLLIGNLTVRNHDVTSTIQGGVEYPFPSHPVYPPPSQASMIFGTATADPLGRGLEYEPRLVVHQESDPDFYEQAFPDVSALQDCTPGEGKPALGGINRPPIFVNPAPLVSFVTTTATSYATLTADAPSFGQTVSTALAPLSSPTASNPSPTSIENSISFPSESATPAPSSGVQASPNIGSIVDSIINGGGPAHVESTTTGVGDVGSLSQVQPTTSSLDVIGNLLSSIALPNPSTPTGQPGSVLYKPHQESPISGAFSATEVEINPASPTTGISALSSASGAQESIASPNSPPLITVGTYVLSLAPNTLAATIGEPSSIQSLSAGSSILVLGTDKAALPNPTMTIPVEPPTIPQPIIVDGQTIVPTTASEYVVGTDTLVPGGPPLTVGGTVISLATNSLGKPIVVLDGSTSIIQGATATPPLITIAGETATPLSQQPGLLIHSETLVPGGPPIILGTGTSTTVVSLATNSAGETMVVIGASTSTITPPPSTATATAAGLFIGSTLASPAPNSLVYVVGSQTLAPGHPITLGSTTISLTTNAVGSTVLMIGTSATTLNPLTPAPTPLGVQTTIVTTGSTPLTEYIIGSQTLFPGHPITLATGNSSTVIALTTDSAGSTVLVVNGNSTTLEGGTIPGTISNTSSGLLTPTITLSIGTPTTASQTTMTAARLGGHPTSTSSTEAVFRRPSALNWTFGVLLWLMAMP